MAVYTRAAAQVRKRSSCFKYASTDIIVSTNVRSYLSKTNDKRTHSSHSPRRISEQNNERTGNERVVRSLFGDLFGERGGENPTLMVGDRAMEPVCRSDLKSNGTSETRAPELPRRDRSSQGRLSRLD